MIVQVGTHKGQLKDAAGVEIKACRWADTDTGVVRVIDWEASKLAGEVVEKEQRHAAPLQWLPSEADAEAV